MLAFFPRGVLDEILNLIESVSEGFPSYSYYFIVFIYLLLHCHYYYYYYYYIILYYKYYYSLKAFWENDKNGNNFPEQNHLQDQLRFKGLVSNIAVWP